MALGWLVSESIQASESRRAEHVPRSPLVAFKRVFDGELQQSLQRFWEIEDVPSSTYKLRPGNEACERQFRETHVRGSDGRYIVRLPLKLKPPEVTVESRRLALGSLSHMHRRFARDPKLAFTYREFMSAYEQLGHMERIPNNQLLNSGAWYLPHHAVVVQSSPSHWKLWVVFDASRRTWNQHCLNEFLMPGPALQSGLSSILLNWRRYRFVFTADIVKMFRQIRVDPEDRDLQRILWSPGPGKTPVSYSLTTVTYGTACPPFLAIRTLQQIAHDEEQRFPLGARCLRINTYVDDTFAGADELSIALKKRDELSGISRLAGIELGKWAANTPELLPNFFNSNTDEIDKRIDLDEVVKTLGVRWRPSSDTFGFTALNPSQN